MKKDKPISPPKTQKIEGIPVSASKSLTQDIRFRNNGEPKRKQTSVKKRPKLKELSQADRLLSLATHRIRLSHDEDGVAYGRLKQKGHYEIWPVHSNTFRDYLTYYYLQRFNRAPNKSSLDQAINTLEAKAKFEGEVKPVYTRLAQVQGRIYVDLCNEQWEVIEIGPQGWSIIRNSPVYFVRNKGMRSLPKPVKGGSVKELKRFINVSTGKDFRIAVAWIIAAFRPGYPFPILILQGEQGSGKSTCARVLRSLIDPSVVSSTHKPKKINDLMIDAHNSWVLSYDNLSGISDELSDGLCQIATGSGYKTRQKYTDTDQIIIRTLKPIILNGIDEVAKRGDLLDRAMVLELSPMSENTYGYKDERTFWKEFEEVRPQLLGALLDVISSALGNIEDINLESNLSIRMADLVCWITAAEGALGWPQGQFTKDYQANKAEAVAVSLSDDPLAQGVIKLAIARETWSGSAGDLREALHGHLSSAEFKSLPASNWVGRELNRLKPSLKKSGIYVERKRSSSGNIWIIRNMNESTGSTESNDGLNGN